MKPDSAISARRCSLRKMILNVRPCNMVESQSWLSGQQSRTMSEQGAHHDLPSIRTESMALGKVLNFF